VAIYGPTRPRAQRPLRRFAPGPSQVPPQSPPTSVAHPSTKVCAPSPRRPGIRGPQGEARRAREPGLMPTFPKRYADAGSQNCRPPAAFLLVAVFAWFSPPDIPFASPWVCRSAWAGLFLRAWAGWLPGQKTNSLPPAGRTPTPATRSISALLLVAAGLVMRLPQHRSRHPFVAVFLLVYSASDAKLEEQQPAEFCFPEYASYSGQVPALVAAVSPQPPVRNPNPFQGSPLSKEPRVSGRRGIRHPGCCFSFGECWGEFGARFS